MVNSSPIFRNFLLLLTTILIFSAANSWAQEIESGEVETKISINPVIESALRRMPGPGVRSQESHLIATVVDSDPDDFSDQMVPAAEVITEPRNQEVEEAPDIEEVDPVEDEMKQFAVRDAYLKRIFLNKNGQWFTRYNRGIIQIPYQLSGFQLIGPDSATLSEEDVANGIEKRTDYLFLIHSFRTFSKSAGWSAWTPGNPPKLTGMTMVRQNGEWKVEDSDELMYSVK